MQWYMLNGQTIHAVKTTNIPGSKILKPFAAMLIKY